MEKRRPMRIATLHHMISRADGDVTRICRMCERVRSGLPGARRHPEHRRIPSRICPMPSQCDTLPKLTGCLSKSGIGITSIIRSGGEVPCDRSFVPFLAQIASNGWLMVVAYLAENSSYVSSSWAPDRRLVVVLKLGRLRARAAGTCTRHRGN
jgi:hypothetical protein